MSNTTESLAKLFGTTIIQEFKKHFLQIMQQMLQGNPQGPQLVQLVTQWLEKATETVGLNIDAIQVNCFRPPSNNATNIAPIQGGFPPQNNMLSLGGAFQSQQVQSTSAPKNAVTSLELCGPAVRIPLSQYPQAPPQNAKCGVQIKPKNQSSYFWCNSNATKPGVCGCWTCNQHKKRKTADHGSTMQSNPRSNGSIRSAQQIIGVSTGNGLPQGVVNNSQASQQIANLMLQGNNNATMNHLQQAVNQSNNMLNSAQTSQNLMTNTANQLQGVPQQGTPNMGGQVNLQALMNQNLNSSVNVSQNPVNSALNGIPNTPPINTGGNTDALSLMLQNSNANTNNIQMDPGVAAALAMINQGTTEVNDDDDYSDSIEEEESDEEHDHQVNQNDLQSALASATNMSQQNTQGQQDISALLNQGQQQITQQNTQGQQDISALLNQGQQQQITQNTIPQVDAKKDSDIQTLINGGTNSNPLVNMLSQQQNNPLNQALNSATGGGDNNPVNVGGLIAQAHDQQNQN